MDAFERNMMRKNTGSDGLQFLYGLFLIASGLLMLGIFITYVIVTLIIRLVRYALEDRSEPKPETTPKE